MMLNKTNNLVKERPRLSICIATFNREKFISETLESILIQMPCSVELIVVDGASPDKTPEVMSRFLLRYPQINYYREPENSGIDRDYDKAVGYASGDYCWLMTDDDLLHAGAISRVLHSLDGNPDLVVVNSTVKTADFSTVLDGKLLKFPCDREYEADERENFFAEVASYLSFIGGVIIKRELWLKRDRSSYYGTLFVHVGVIFQNPPIEMVKVISEPLITIRYGNAMWTARGFEIWMFKWPELIWSFVDFSNSSKSAITPKEPWRLIKKLVLYRAIGGYSPSEYRRFIDSKTQGVSSALYKLIAFSPAKVVNFFSGLYCVLINRNARLGLYDLTRSRHATWATRFLGRLL